MIFKACRKLENTMITITREYAHLKFNHQCKRERTLAKALRFTPPIKSPKGYAIARHYAWQLMNLRIATSHQKIKQKKELYLEIENDLNKKLDSSHFNSFQAFIQYKKQQLTSKLVSNHQGKLDRLLKQYTGTGVATNIRNKDTGTNSKTDKWVKNLSTRILNANEIDVLKKGFKYAIAPRKISTPKLLSDVEKGLAKIPADDEAAVTIARSKITNILKQARMPEPNLTSKDYAALKSLRNDKNTVILQADKGNCSVLMDKTDYIEKMTVLLSD